MSHPIPSPSPSLTLPCVHAHELSCCLDAIRVETAHLVECGLLTISADELIGGATDVDRWLTDLDAAVLAARNGVMHLPVGPPGDLQQVVYALSAVLVWAEELHVEGRLRAPISQGALTAWACVEQAAGMPGRTAAVVGHRATRPERATDVPRIAVLEPLRVPAAV